MPLLVSYLVDDAARKIGDPNKTRVTNADWTLFYNQSVRELCQKSDTLQFRAKFNLTTEALYPYPDEMTQMTSIEVSATPSDTDSFQYVAEAFEDEFRHMTSYRYPTNALPTHYFADKLGFYLIGRPDALITDGGRITYFGIPDRITDITIATYQLPQFTQDYVIRRMVVYGKTARNRHDEANAELQQWYTDVEGLQDKIDDRSSDRRSSLRPRRNPYAGMR